MGDIVYWDGGEYLAPKAVASAAIVELPSIILVDWGGGDIEELTGNSWTVQKTVYGGWFVRGTVAGNWTNCAQYTSELWLIQGGGWATKTTHPPYPATSENWNVTNGEKNPNKIFSAIFAGNQNSCGASTTWNIRDSQNIFYVYLSFRKSTPSFHFSTREKIRITTDLGSFSERGSPQQGAFPPTISGTSGGCAIAITYEDATTEELPLSYCPPWVRIRSDQECPEGSCRVECETHYCCYDSCTGAVTKVIPK